MRHEATVDTSYLKSDIKLLKASNHLLAPFFILLIPPAVVFLALWVFHSDPPSTVPDHLEVAQDASWVAFCQD